MAFMVRPDQQLSEPTPLHEILVIDDEEPIRLALKDYLAQQGLAVTCAGEAAEATALLNNGHYAVAIVDLRLKGSNRMEGLDILSAIRQRTPETRTVLLSANISAEAEQMARTLGVDALLHKPAPLARVASIVFGLLGQHPTSEN